MAEQLVLEQVHKRFGNGVAALDDISLTVSPGTFLVLLGPSGSGKTTLIRSVAGIERISSGRVVIGDRVVAHDRLHVPSERRGLSMVFQDYALWPHLTVLGNVAFALRRHKAPGDLRRRQAAEMLEMVGLGRHHERYPSELSGGEQQRVALARALVGDSALVLCDEPLSNLDADLRERMRVEISQLVRASGATTLYITHDQAEAFALADRVGVLQHGRLVQLGTPEAVYSTPATPAVARFTGVAAELRVRSARPARSGEVVELLPVELRAQRPIRAEAIGALGAGPCLLLVRPAAVQLCETDSEECHLTGSVADVAFRGRGYELAVDLPAGVRVSSVFTNLRAQRGATVGLRLGPSGCLVYAADGVGSPDGPIERSERELPALEQDGGPGSAAMAVAGALTAPMLSE